MSKASKKQACNVTPHDARTPDARRSRAAGIAALALIAVVAAAGTTYAVIANSRTNDTIVPRVVSTVPASNATGVFINRAVTATFNRAMDISSLTTTSFFLKHGTTSVAGVVTLSTDKLTAVFTPSGNLVVNTNYTATITTGAKGTNGLALAANKVWNFTSGALEDLILPNVSVTIPLDNAVGVLTNANISAAFSEPMLATTISTSTFTLYQGTTKIDGSVFYLFGNAIFDPSNVLADNTIYTATVTTGVKDLAGNALAVDKVWSFTTGITTVAQLPVNLGTAGDFVILAKSMVSTTGTTNITGWVGVSPAAESFITGFALVKDVSNQWSTSSLVTGRVYAADDAPPTPAFMTTAVSDMEAAYVDAAGRTNPTATELGAGEIGGMTLAGGGLYKWGTGVSISTDLYLTGSVTDVWIFQIAQGLTLANGIQVHVAGGLAKNIFWQVGGDVVLGTTSVMYGNILCLTQIAMNTGATLYGRALAQTAVTLDANNVIVPLI